MHERVIEREKALGPEENNKIYINNDILILFNGCTGKSVIFITIQYKPHSGC